jgi:hypothetical protein
LKVTWLEPKKTRADNDDAAQSVITMLRAYFHGLRTKFVFDGSPIHLDEVISSRGFLPAIDWVARNRISSLGHDSILPFAKATASGLLGFKLSWPAELETHTPAYKYFMLLAAEDLLFEHGPTHDTTIDLTPIYTMFMNAGYESKPHWSAEKL